MDIDVKRETIAFNGSETCYKVKISAFIHKMVSSKCQGKVIRSQSFYHYNLKFRLEVHPQGKTDSDDDWIYVGIKNDNPTPVEFEGVLSLGYLDRNIKYLMEPFHWFSYPFAPTGVFTTIIFDVDETEDDEDEEIQISLIVKKARDGYIQDFTKEKCTITLLEGLEEQQLRLLKI